MKIYFGDFYIPYIAFSSDDFTLDKYEFVGEQIVDSEVLFIETEECELLADGNIKGKKYIFVMGDVFNNLKLDKE